MNSERFKSSLRYLKHAFVAPHHALYHPHQRIWNIYSKTASKVVGLERLVVIADTFALRVEAVLRRLRLSGFANLGDLPPIHRKVVYFDIGLHTEAMQIQLVRGWFRDWPHFKIYGFEAHPDYAEACRKRFAGDSNIEIFNLALVGPEHEGNTVALHLAGGSGVGNSLFEAKGDQTIQVPAIRLSEFISQHADAMKGAILILRMNIEGAETYVIDDLVDAGIADKIGGYYGTWDDLFKIDPRLDAGFRRKLKRAGIRSFPFNDRDTIALAGKKRKDIIRYDIVTSIRAAAKMGSVLV